MAKPNSKRLRFIFLIMTCVALLFTLDYLSLILDGDDSLRRQIVLVVWIGITVLNGILAVKHFIGAKKQDRDS